MSAKEICEDCGKVYMAGPASFFCPKCRKRRIAKAASENAKKRSLSKLGVKARTSEKAAESVVVEP